VAALGERRERDVTRSCGDEDPQNAPGGVWKSGAVSSAVAGGMHTTTIPAASGAMSGRDAQQPANHRVVHEVLYVG